MPREWPEAVVGLAKRLIRIREVVSDAEFPDGMGQPSEGMLFEAHHPYSNLRHVRQLVAQVSGDVVWIDRHGELATLDVIAFSAVGGQQTSFVLIREGQPDERLRRAATHLRQELSSKGIDFDVRCVAADSWSAHDRWVISSEGVWALPPMSSPNRVGEVRPSSDPTGVRVLADVLLTASTSVFG